LDIPQVTLVGVINADTALNLPDFRAGERTFSLLTQVAGRAGRGDVPGRVIIQTYCPDHYAILAAARHDYATFYQIEIAMRRRLRLPPVQHMIELTVQGRKADAVRQASEHLAEQLRRALQRHGATLLGPAPHRIETLKGLARWRVILKVAEVLPIIAVLREVLGPSRRYEHLAVVIDVDPL
jgi:primosomal protein N' (replication factor Y)